MPWRLCDLPKCPAALTTKPQPIPFPTSVRYLGTGAAVISGRFSALPPPRKRSSRPSLSLYLDFPLTSTPTFSASDPLPSLPFTSPGTSTSAGIGNVGGGDDGGGGDGGGGGGDDDDDEDDDGWGQCACGCCARTCARGRRRQRRRHDSRLSAIGGSRRRRWCGGGGQWGGGAGTDRRRGRWLCS